MIVPGDLFGVLPLWVPVFIIGAIGITAGSYAIYARFVTPVLLGKREDPRFDHPLQRLWGMVLVVFGHRRVLMSVSWRWRDLAGIGHFIIFWGFMSKLVGYTLFLVLDPIKPTNSAFVLSPTGLEVFFWWLDILTVLVLASVIWAAVRRWIGRPKRLEGLQGYEPGIILMATGSLMLFHQLTQISIVAAAEANPAPSPTSAGRSRRRSPPEPRFRGASARRSARRASPPRRPRRCTASSTGCTSSSPWASSSTSRCPSTSTSSPRR